MIRIEDIVLNIGFLTFRYAEILDESPSLDDSRQTISIGDAIIYFNPCTHTTDDPHHFASFMTIIGDKDNSEFFLIADIWSSVFTLSEDTIDDAAAVDFDYENIDIVFAKNGINHLIKNVELAKKMPINFVDSFYIMKYTWRGNIAAFERELFVEKMKTNVIFYEYFADAVVMKQEEL